MTYKELLKYLLSISDTKFANFSKTLSNSDYEVIGVKNPILRKIIKDHKLDNELKIEDFVIVKYLEIDFIYFGLNLSRLNNYDLQLSFIKKYIKKAKSWGITDCLSSFMKKGTFDKYFNFFLSMYNSKFIYERRTAYVLGLKYYSNKEILKILNYIKFNEDYMVMMSQAWLLATIAINFPSEVYDYLNSINDLVLKRKTISKIIDSFRFDDSTKNKFKKLREL